MKSLSVDFAYLPSGTVSDVAMLAALGEKLGFRGLWIPDQNFFRDPFVLCAAAIGATSTLQVGIGITSPLTRHPIQIARGAATLAELAPGRFRLGVGTGNVPNVVLPMGVPATRPLARLRAGITELTQLLAGQQVRYTEDDDVPAVKLDFSVAERIPVYVGARGGKTLAMGAELTDGVLAESLFTEGGAAHARDAVRSGCEAAGRDVAEIDAVSWQVVYVTDDPASVVQRFRPWLVRTLQVGPREVMLRAGVSEEVLNEVAAALADGDPDRAARAVTEDAAHCLLLIGPPDYLVERISELPSRGYRSMSLLSVDPAPACAANLTRFATEVMPYLHLET